MYYRLSNLDNMGQAIYIFYTVQKIKMNLMLYYKDFNYFIFIIKI
jgi:hypothetical protein